MHGHVGESCILQVDFHLGGNSVVIVDANERDRLEKPVSGRDLVEATMAAKATAPKRSLSAEP